MFETVKIIQQRVKYRKILIDLPARTETTIDLIFKARNLMNVKGHSGFQTTNDRGACFKLREGIVQAPKTRAGHLGGYF